MLRHKLIEWLGKMYPADVVKFKRMRKAQLYAIWLNVRLRRG